VSKRNPNKYKPKYNQSPLSKFYKEATKEERKKVFLEVARKAIEKQNQIKDRGIQITFMVIDEMTEYTGETVTNPG